ncbi:hypothetical protein Tco_0882313 [Tanacetum coccineum]
MDLKDEDLVRFLADKEVINILLLGLPKEVYKTVDATKSENKVWEEVIRHMEGSEVGSNIRRLSFFRNLINSHPFYGNLIITNIRYTTLLNKLARNGFVKRPIESNIKFLNHLRPGRKHYVSIFKKT